MLKKWFARFVVGAALVLGAGCAHCRDTPQFESQAISTRGTVRLDINLSDSSTVQMLVGTRADDPSQIQPGKPGQQSARAMLSLLAAAPAQVTFSDSEDMGGSPAPLISSGFIYIVRPPAWPVVRTPSTRGGPPVSDSWDGLAYVGAAVEGGVQRIFFLGAFDAHGDAIAGARIKVDDFPIHPSNPADVFLTVGQYAEATLSGSTLQIVVGEHPVTSSSCPAEVRSLLIQMRQHAEENDLPWNPAMDIPVPGSS
jgi:hypothetical protein